MAPFISGSCACTDALSMPDDSAYPEANLQGSSACRHARDPRTERESTTGAALALHAQAHGDKSGVAGAEGAAAAIDVEQPSLPRPRAAVLPVPVHRQSERRGPTGCSGQDPNRQACRKCLRTGQRMKGKWRGLEGRADRTSQPSSAGSRPPSSRATRLRCCKAAKAAGFPCLGLHPDSSTVSTGASANRIADTSLTSSGNLAHALASPRGRAMGRCWRGVIGAGVGCAWVNRRIRRSVDCFGCPAHVPALRVTQTTPDVG